MHFQYGPYFSHLINGAAGSGFLQGEQVLQVEGGSRMLRGVIARLHTQG